MCDTESIGLIPAPWHMVWLVCGAFAGSSGCSDQTQDPKQGCHIFRISRQILFFWNGALATQFGCSAHPAAVGLSGLWSNPNRAVPLQIGSGRSTASPAPGDAALKLIFKGDACKPQLAIWWVHVKGLCPITLFKKLPSVGSTKWPSRRDHPWPQSNISKHRQEEPCTKTSLC